MFETPAVFFVVFVAGRCRVRVDKMGEFLQKAIQIVQQATDKDNAKEYPEAMRLYQLSLDYFMAALKCTARCTPSETDSEPAR